jgi:hypothetical protein
MLFWVFGKAVRAPPHAKSRRGVRLGVLPVGHARDDNVASRFLTEHFSR